MRRAVASAIFTLAAILSCISADDISALSTSLLLPDGLFSSVPSGQIPTFGGRATVTRSITYYTLGCDHVVELGFEPGDECQGGDYTFSENSGSTMYTFSTM